MPFEGAWKLTGQAYDSPFGTNAEVSGYETFEWLTGDEFLVHHLEGRQGDRDMACVEILGRDANGDAFEAHSFYGDGTASVWRLERRGAGWAMTTAQPNNGGTFALRCTITFESRVHRRGTWEYSSDGSVWRIFWETEAERLS
jgi:hypothetical protein